MAPSVPVKKPNTIVLITGPLSESALILLDTLRVRNDALYLTVLNAAGADVRQHTEDAEVISLDAFLAREERQSHDLLFIPDCDCDYVAYSALAKWIPALYYEGCDVIAAGTGRLLLAHSGLLRQRLASSAFLKQADNYADEVAAWVKEEIVCHARFWTASGNLSIAYPLACLFKAERKGDRITDFPLHAFWSHRRGGRPSELPEDEPPHISTTPGADLAKAISKYRPSDAEGIPQLVLILAIRLGVEGFVDSCNSLLLTLISVFPNVFSGLASIYVRSLEYIWLAAGARPAVSWSPPSHKEVNTWELDARENHDFPTDEDREDILGSIKARIMLARETWMLRPYTLAGACAMALDAGKEDLAREWLSMLIHDAMTTELSPVWLDVARWKDVAELAVTSGSVSGVTGRTSEMAEQDAAIVREALLSFSVTAAAVETQHRKEMEKFVRASMSSLTQMLDVLKSESHETLLKPPASLTAIHDVEERLGISLPDDYKEFLLISNGLGCMPSIHAPGFRSVGELEWQDAEDLGINDFRVDLGCKTDPAEYERLPNMNRVLVISDSNDEEMVWYVDPETAGEAIGTLKSEGRSDETVGQPGWRAVFWVHYLPDLKWLQSFRGYVQYLARRAEKAGAKLE